MSTSPIVSGPRCSPPLYAVSVISAAALAYEILLMRLFSIIQWHHFAYMVISLALLGYGASGTFLTLLHDRLRSGFAVAFLINSVLFGISSVLCFLIVQRVPFNTLEMLWDTRQWGLLLFVYLLLFIPFFFAANCICLTFSRFGDAIPRIYSFDLLGAGFGALGILLALTVMHPMSVLLLLGALGFFAGAIGIVEIGMRYRWRTAALLFAAAVFTAVVPSRWLDLRMSEYKGLSQALQVPGTEIIAQRSSPLGLIAVIRSSLIPLRYAPGLSLNSTSELPPQLGVFSDGEAMGAITRYDGRRRPLKYLDYLTSALPYHVSRPDRTLVLGVGGGGALLQALYHGLDRIDAVELNPQVVRLIQEEFRSFSGASFWDARVGFHVGEARSYLAGTQARYDLIQLPLLDASGAASSGLYALNESYLYTLEGLGVYLDRLKANGLLAITRWVRLPPRDGLKLLNTAISALRAAGIDHPEARLAMIRGWKTSTLLIKNGAYEEREIEQLKSFCAARSFDVVYYPGMSAAEANVYNVLSHPYYHEGALALLGKDAKNFETNYKFDIRPATDNRPYFHNFFRWSVLPEILSLYGRGGLSLLELGYPVLVTTLLQAFLVSLVLIMLPLFFLKQDRQRPRASYAWRIALYFSAIGLAFLFLEIAFMQRFILFLGHPIHTIAVVLCGFLVFSGLGSRFAPHFSAKLKVRPVLPIVLVLAMVALCYLWLLGVLFDSLIALSEPSKIAISLVLIAPLAFCMGMPFPLALARVAADAPQLVPWAWGINGCSSLLSAILATLLAIHFGFATVVILALGLYLVAGTLSLAPR